MPYLNAFIFSTEFSIKSGKAKGGHNQKKKTTFVTRKKKEKPEGKEERPGFRQRILPKAREKTSSQKKKGEIIRVA